MRELAIHKGLEPSFTRRQRVAFPDGKWTLTGTALWIRTRNSGDTTQPVTVTVSTA